MKNLYLGLAAGLILATPIVFAQGVGFDETTSQEVTVAEVGENYAVIKFPVLIDDNGDIITKYAIFYATTPLDQTDSALVDQRDIDLDNPTPEVSFSGEYVLYRLDNLQPDTTYYYSVAPLFENEDGSVDLGAATTAGKSFVTLAPAAPTADEMEQQEQHQVPPVKAAIDNISHSISGNEVTLSWTYAGPEDVMVDVYVVDPATSEATKVTSVPATQQGAVITVAEGGDIVVRLVPVDAQGEQVGAEKEYAIKVETTPGQPTVEQPPKVGPATNLLIAISIVFFIAYIIYSYRKEEVN